MDSCLPKQASKAITKGRGIDTFNGFFKVFRMDRILRSPEYGSDDTYFRLFDGPPGSQAIACGAAGSDTEESDILIFLVGQKNIAQSGRNMVRHWGHCYH